MWINNVLNDLSEFCETSFWSQHMKLSLLCGGEACVVDPAGSSSVGSNFLGLDWQALTELLDLGGPPCSSQGSKRCTALEAYYSRKERHDALGVHF